MEKKKISLFMLEDSASDIALLKAHLSKSTLIEATVKASETFEKAKTILRNFRFDIILTDLSVPDSYGLGTLGKLIEYSSDSPIVVLTGHADKDQALQALKQGAEDYILKNDINTEMIERVILHCIERHTLKKDLAQREEQLSKITSHNLDGTLIIDENKTIRYANPAAQSLLNQGHDLLDKEYPFEIKRNFTETVIIPNKGKIRHLEIRMTSIFWNRKDCYLASIRDITLRKKNEKLEQQAAALEEIKQLAGGIAHEFSQPLQVLSGSLEIMHISGPQMNRILKCEEMVHKINALVTNLRDIVQLEKKPYLNTKIIDLKASSQQKPEEILLPVNI